MAVGQAGGVPGRRPNLPRPPLGLPASTQHEQGQSSQVHDGPAPFPVSSRPADHADGPPAVGRDAGRLAQAIAPVPSTPALPTPAVGGHIRTILSGAAPAQAANLFESINRLKQIAEVTYDAHLYEEAMTANNMVGRLALKTIEMTVGKQINVNATIQNQTSVPRWDKIPKEVQDKFLEALASVPETTIIEGEIVPSTDEGYQQYQTEGGPHDSTP